MLEERLQELRREFTLGQSKLEELDCQRVQIRDTLLRISGAIRVLEELLNEEHRQRPADEEKGDERRL